MSTVYVVLKCVSARDSHRDVTAECGPPSFDRSKLWPSMRIFSHRRFADAGRGATRRDRRDRNPDARVGYIWSFSAGGWAQEGGEIGQLAGGGERT